jgi:hypothetical protein
MRVGHASCEGRTRGSLAMRVSFQYKDEPTSRGEGPQ